VEEKMEPYTRYISDLMLKLHKLRSANKMFLDNGSCPPQFNSKYFEILPLKGSNDF